MARTFRRIPAVVADLRQAPGNAEVAAEPAAEAEPAEPDYAGMKKDELVALADERGVDSSGTKAEIAERLSGV